MTPSKRNQTAARVLRQPAGAPASQRTILGLVSLFRVPVDEKTLRRLAQNPSVVPGLNRLSNDEIRGELTTLCRDHLVIRDHEAPRRVTYSCYRILLDHFRGSFLGQNHSAAEGVADLLKGRPASGTSGSLREIELVLSAIEVLLATVRTSAE